MNGKCLVFVLALPTACSAQSVVPALAYCNDAGCNPNTIVSGGNGGSGSGADSGNGTLGLTLSVSVVEFTSSAGATAWSPANVNTLSGTFTVNVPSTSGTINTAVGPSPISVPNSLVSDQSWVSVMPATSSGYFPGIHNVPSDNANSVSVPLLKKIDLDFVQSLLSTQPIIVDPEKAQVIVKVVDINGNGVPGVHASPVGAQVTTYASGNTWLDDSSISTTDVSGRIMAVNLSAGTQGGGFVSFTVSGLSLQGSPLTVTSLIPIQAGFVSYGTLLYQ